LTVAVTNEWILGGEIVQEISEYSPGKKLLNRIRHVLFGNTKGIIPLFYVKKEESQCSPSSWRTTEQGKRRSG